MPGQALPALALCAEWRFTGQKHTKALSCLFPSLSASEHAHSALGSTANPSQGAHPQLTLTHTHSHMCMHTQTPHHSTHKPGFSDRLTLLHTFLLPSLFPHTCGHTCPTPGPAHLDPFSTAGPFFHPASAWDTPCVPVRPTHHNSPSRERKC